MTAALLAIARKQKPEREEVDAIAIALLVAFDAAKRGICPNSGANTIIEHMVAAYYLGVRAGSVEFLEVVKAGYEALGKASERPGLLRLTTGEYGALQLAIRAYLLALPRLEIGLLKEAQAQAQEMLVA